MTNAMLQLIIFVAIGAAWRYVSPMGINAGTMQRNLFGLIYGVLLPIVALVAFWKFKMDERALKMLFIIALATGGVMAAAWFYLKQSKLSPRVQGALFIAASFGAVAFMGAPMADTFRKVLSWSGGRVGIEFFVVANIIILLTVGVFFLRQYSGMERAKNPAEVLIKEPIFIASAIGVLLGLMEVKVPSLVSFTYEKTLVSMFPMMLITLGLCLNWNPSWSKHIKKSIAPIAAMKLLLLPLLLYLLVMMIGPIGKLTGKSLIMFTIMPSSLYGLMLCERYKLDTAIYTAVLTVTTVGSFILIPFIYGLTAI